MARKQKRKHVIEKQDEPGKFIPMTHRTEYSTNDDDTAMFHSVFEKSALELNTTAKKILDDWAKERLEQDRQWFRRQVEKYYLEAMRDYINQELDK